MSESESDGEPDIVIRRRKVNKDISIEEQEMRISDGDVDFDVQEFEDSLDESMDEAVENMDRRAEKRKQESEDDEGGEATTQESEPEPDDDGGDEDESEELDISITPQEAADMWDTSERNAFNSDCLSGAKEPQLGMAACSQLYNKILELGLDEESDGDTAGDDDADESDGSDGEDDEPTGAGRVAKQLDADVDPADVEKAFLVYKGGSDAGTAALDQFKSFINDGILERAEFFNSPAAKEIKDNIDQELDTPALVLKTSEGYHVV